MLSRTATWAWSTRQLGRIDEAISEFQAALRIYPKYADAHCGLGVVYGQLGRLAEARQENPLALQLG